jgi:hypothetical protein
VRALGLTVAVWDIVDGHGRATIDASGIAASQAHLVIADVSDPGRRRRVRERRSRAWARCATRQQRRTACRRPLFVRRRNALGAGSVELVTRAWMATHRRPWPASSTSRRWPATSPAPTPRGTPRTRRPSPATRERWRSRLAPSVRVNAVAPSLVNTPARRSGPTPISVAIGPR